MAAKPVDFDYSVLVRLADHASKLLREFTELDDPADRQKMPELLAELEHLIGEFRRLRPPPTLRNGPPTFRNGPPTLRLVRKCAICGLEIRKDHESFETLRAAYHVDCTKA